MTESLNSTWWSSKLEVPIFQLVDELATRFQIIILYVFGFGQFSVAMHTQHCHTTLEVGIQDGRHNNVSSYNSALTQCNDREDFNDYRHPFPINKWFQNEQREECNELFDRFSRYGQDCHCVSLIQTKHKQKAIQCSKQSVLYKMSFTCGAAATVAFLWILPVDLLGHVVQNIASYFVCVWFESMTLTNNIVQIWRIELHLLFHL